jgi:hypothetical protein
MVMPIVIGRVGEEGEEFKLRNANNMASDKFFMS